MYCNHCGALNPDASKTCSKCGKPLTAASAGAASPLVPGEKIPNRLIPAILTTACCCLPFGIVAIVYAAQVDGKAAGGDLEGARRASASAKMWCWIAVGCGVLSVVAWFLFGLLPMLMNPDLQRQFQEEMRKAQQQQQQQQVENPQQPEEQEEGAAP